MKTLKNVLRVALAALALTVVADVAQACSFECVNVGPGFCQRCQDVGYNTGGYCQNFGACGCFELPGICWNSAAQDDVDQLLAALSLPRAATSVALDEPALASPSSPAQP